VKAFPSRDLGDPWRGRTPGEERLRREGNTERSRNGLAGGANPWRRLTGKGTWTRSLLCSSGLEPGGNVKRGAGVGRRNGFLRGETSEGKTPRAQRYETRPRRIRGEQSAERLRKPESAAQPGKVSPV
jgi:hypothetical protein